MKIEDKINILILFMIRNDRRLKMKKTILQFAFIGLAICMVFISSGNAAVINAASCSQSHVQAAISSAAAGDVVAVPAGQCSWVSDVTIPDSKKITLKGAGIDQTVISNTGTTALYVNIGNSGSRLTGFSFREISVRLYLGDARIDHNKFYTATTSPGSGVYFTTGLSSVYETPRALVDHNQFENCRVVVIGNVMHNKAWTLPLNLGGISRANIVYVEDNEFRRTYTSAANAMDANYGGAYVFRYNTIYGINAMLNIMAHSIQGPNRATRGWAIYGNIIHTDVTAYHQTFRLRGGTGVVFYNSITGKWVGPSIDLDNVRSIGAEDGSGKCDGSSTWDGNKDATGYPCRDQIGRGPDAELWVTGTGAYTQSLMPAYAWVNRTEANADVPFYVRDAASAAHIKANRDFYDYNPTFNGTSGMGAGSLASRPTTCTTGVAYWATNQSTSDLTGMVGTNPRTPISGTLYKCTATNTWTAYFTPYIYPHPLSSQETLSQPGVPRSLRINTN